MKMKLLYSLKIVIFPVIICILFSLIACVKYENKDKYFYVEDVFTITVDEVKYTVVTGYFVGGIISVEDKLIFNVDGNKIVTKVVKLENIDGDHPTSVNEYVNIAVWIDKYLSDKIKSGDKLYYKR